MTRKKYFTTKCAESDRFDLFDQNVFFIIVFFDQDFLIANLLDCCLLLL